MEVPEDHRPIGRWGRMHRDYLKEHRPVIYNHLVLSGNLWAYLADINEQAQERMEVLIKQMKDAKGITEELKEANQMEWVRRMHGIRNRSTEAVLSEIVYE